MITRIHTLVSRSSCSSRCLFRPDLSSLPPLAPFQWSLQYPYANPFASEPDDTGCLTTDKFMDGKGASFNMTITNQPAGTIYRYLPAYFYRSSPVTDIRGIGLQAEFRGNGTNNDEKNGLWHSAFFHSQRCYGGTTEFGFRRVINNTMGGPSYPSISEAIVQFYFTVNTNCSITNLNCSVTNGYNNQSYYIGEWGYGGNLPIPTVPNSRNGDDWLYLAWLEPGATYWMFEIVDPYTNQLNNVTQVTVPTPPNDVPQNRPDLPSGIFQQYAFTMIPPQGGLSGYLSMTSELGSSWVSPPNPVTNVSMNVVNLFAVK